MTDNIEKLKMVAMVLNNIPVHGKQNLLNLGAAIDILESVAAALNGESETETADIE